MLEMAATGTKKIILNLLWQETKELDDVYITIERSE